MWRTNPARAFTQARSRQRRGYRRNAEAYRAQVFAQPSDRETPRQPVGDPPAQRAGPPCEGALFLSGPGLTALEEGLRLCRFNAESQVTPKRMARVDPPWLRER